MDDGDVSAHDGAPPIGASPRRVLLVEDDTGVLRMLRVMLRSAGFETREVRTGEEALVELAGDSGPDVVVLDLGLPDDKARDVLSKLLGGDDGMPNVITISALDEDEARRIYGDIGPRFLAKPFDPWDLVREIEAVT